jgi:hypothetical protein
MAFPLHTDDIVLVGPIYALSASTAINTNAPRGGIKMQPLQKDSIRSQTSRAGASIRMQIADRYLGKCAYIRA